MEVVRILLEQGADTEAKDHFLLQSPLSKASQGGHAEVCQVLLEHGADVKSECVFGNTPLHDANGEEVARVLLEHDADTNALNRRGQTPLHHMSRFGHLGAARALLEHGVDVNTRDADNAIPLHLASDTPYLQDEARTEFVRLLLQYGSDIHARDNEGRTPSMRATVGPTVYPPPVERRRRGSWEVIKTIDSESDTL